MNVSNPGYELRQYCSEDFENDPALTAQLIAYCRQALSETDKPAISNMGVEGWAERPETLLYSVLRERRFRRGEGLFCVLSKGETWVAISGAYRSDFHPEVFIGGVRAWTTPAFRSRYLHGDHIFPVQQEWATKSGGKVFLLTFNDYNKKLAELFVRAGKYDRATGFGVSRSDFYRGIEMHPRPVSIKNVPQWILIKKLDASFDFDFDSLAQ